MTKTEQKRLINDLMGNVKKDILQHNYPEHWNGVELRWLIREKCAQTVFGGFEDRRQKRYKDFENECIVNNWL